MPDITMCTSSECAVAGRCYRNSASGTKPTDMLQAFSEFEPAKGAECSGFWSATKDLTVSLTHLERAPQPDESELFHTAILDDWRILTFGKGEVHHVVRGLVSGDSRWTAGHDIRTSPIAAMDSERKWCRTQNTLYRLGCPRGRMPLIVETACRPTWDEAREHACTGMGRHTVSNFIWSVAVATDGRSVDGGKSVV